MNLSGSLTEKASPFGSQDTTEGSSLRSISISFLGKGFECPGAPAGDDVADNAGELPRLGDELRMSRRLMLSLPLSGDPVSLVGALVTNDDTDTPVLEEELVVGVIFITPAAMELSTGTRTTPEATAPLIELGSTPPSAGVSP